MFPSPYGDYGSYQMLSTPLNKAACIVSVPLRGLWFLSTFILANIKGRNEFPSPYGDYGSYRDYKWEDAYAYTENVSVPLRGLWFLSRRLIFRMI